MTPRERLIAALEIGLEHTQTVLSRHDVDLGRTTHSNNVEAETLEYELKQIHDVIALVKQIAIGRWVSVEERLPEFDTDGHWHGITRDTEGDVHACLCLKGVPLSKTATHWLELDLPSGKGEA